VSGVTLSVSDFVLRKNTKLPTNTTNKSKKIHYRYVMRRSTNKQPDAPCGLARGRRCLHKRRTHRRDGGRSHERPARFPIPSGRGLVLRDVNQHPSVTLRRFWPQPRPTVEVLLWQMATTSATGNATMGSQRCFQVPAPGGVTTNLGCRCCMQGACRRCYGGLSVIATDSRLLPSGRPGPRTTARVMPHSGRCRRLHNNRQQRRVSWPLQKAHLRAGALHANHRRRGGLSSHMLWRKLQIAAFLLLLAIFDICFCGHLNYSELHSVLAC
jgi:hypothetical protein